MRNISKKILALATAAVLSAGAISLAACGSNFSLPAGSIPQGPVSSNGGFVVSVGDDANGYYYFINGVETYTSDNTYGTPVKGALMRSKKADVAAGKGDAEIIVPSLMVSGDYTAGIFIYGERVYYATPTNVRNTAGVVENSYLDFKSAKLDGTDIKDLFRLSSNTTVYRYVEVEGTVYAVYAEGTSSYTLHSFNTASGVDTVLAEGVTQYLLDSVDKTNPAIYYTMSVTEKIATDGARTAAYNQLYRVRADATEIPDGYAYKAADYWDMQWLEENNGGAIPYVNLGEIVLDGRSTNNIKTDFNHSDATPSSAYGYTYTLRSYKNDGVYFTLSETNGKGGDLYYLPESAIGASGFDSVLSNPIADDSKQCTKLANNIDAANKATDAAFFYLEGDTHHYLYVANSCIYRVDIDENGNPTTDLMIASGVGSATIIDTDSTSDSTFDYVYYTQTNGNGLSIERAVYNGKADNYKNLTYEGEDNAPYKPVKLLNLQHASGWYNYEIVDGTVFYADAEQFGGTAYTYTSAVSLKKDGKLMTNVELEAINDLYESVTSTDKTVGLFGKLDDAFGDSDLSNAVKYYFYTGKTEQFQENIDEAVSYDQKETSLYTEKEQAAFKAFAEGKGYTLDDEKKSELFTDQSFVDGAGKSYRTYDYFRVRLGQMSESDEQSFAEYWKTSGLAHYTPPAETEEGLAWWAWLLIAIAIALVVAAGVMVALYFFYYKKKKNATSEPKRRVRTQVDEDIDVYAEDETSEPEEPDEAEEPDEGEPEEPAESEAEDVAEEPAEPETPEAAEPVAAEEPAAPAPATEEPAAPANPETPTDNN